MTNKQLLALALALQSLVNWSNPRKSAGAVQELWNKAWLFGISLLIVIMVLWYQFRHWSCAVLPLLGVGMTIVLTLGLMGYTQFKQLYLVQIVDVVGVYGLSFLIVIINTLIFNLLFERRSHGPMIPILETSLVTLLMLTTLLYGFHRLSDVRSLRASCPPLNAALVQANIDQSVKWSPGYQK